MSGRMEARLGAPPQRLPLLPVQDAGQVGPVPLEPRPPGEVVPLHHEGPLRFVSYSSNRPGGVLSSVPWRLGSGPVLCPRPPASVTTVSVGRSKTLDRIFLRRDRALRLPGGSVMENDLFGFL